jgi:hypothetical protein
LLEIKRASTENQSPAFFAKVTHLNTILSEEEDRKGYVCCYGVYVKCPDRKVYRDRMQARCCQGLSRRP